MALTDHVTLTDVRSRGQLRHWVYRCPVSWEISKINNFKSTELIGHLRYMTSKVQENNNNNALISILETECISGRHCSAVVADMRDFTLVQ